MQHPDPKEVAKKIYDYLSKKGIGHPRDIVLSESDSGYLIEGYFMRPAGYTEDGDVIHVDVAYKISIDYDGTVDYEVEPIETDTEVDEDFAERLGDVAALEVEEWIKEAIKEAVYG